MLAGGAGRWLGYTGQGRGGKGVRAARVENVLKKCPHGAWLRQPPRA